MNSDLQPIKICFTLPLAYPLFNLAYHGPFGGWEVRVSLIARELARRRHFEVAIIVGDHGQPHVEVIDNVRLISWTGRDLWGVPSQKKWNPFPEKSIPHNFWDRAQKRIFATFSHYFPGKVIGYINDYRITSKMIEIYDEVNADIFIVPGNTPVSAEVAYYCIQENKKYVFLSGSDMDYYPEYKTNPKGTDIYKTPNILKTFSIENAHAHVVQNEYQAKMLQNGYGRSSTIIRNPIDTRPNFPRAVSPQTVLWVGKSDERIKRPSIPIELARRMPEFQFVMIMNKASLKDHLESLHKARELPNVEIIEQVPFEKVEEYFANARIHINTSTLEGFPNTYLQAAKYGVPTITTTIDPGLMLSKHGCGLLSGESIDGLEANILRLMHDDLLYAELSRNALKYVQAYHDKKTIIPEYEALLKRVMEKGRIE